MDLFEYQGKELFGRFGIPVGTGRIATTPEEARAAAEELGGPVVVKAQVLTGGRGKAGGVKVAADADEAEQHARAILGLDIRGHVVRSVWVERAAEIAKEYYLSITFDRGARAPLLMLTTRGGVDIEQVAAESPEALARLHVDPLEGYRPHHGRRLVYGAGIADAEEQRQVLEIVARLYRCFVESDAMLCEINPLIVTSGGEVVALDAKVTIDDSALFRQPDLEGLRDTAAADPLEAFARERGRDLRQARRVGRDPRQRRRALDVDRRRGHGRGRPAGELLRPGRRRLGAGRGRRARGDRARPAGALDPLQHFRRHHALRRGRARDPDRARAACRSRCRSSSASTARTPRRAAASSPMRASPRFTSSRRCSMRRGAPWSWRHDPKRRRMSDPWSERAQLYRDSKAHSEGADLDLVVEWAAGLESAIDVATGGGHVARRLREAGLQVVSCDPSPGMQPDVICFAEDLPFADVELRLRRDARGGPPLRRRPQGRRPSWRALRASGWWSSTRSTAARRSSRPRSSATRRTSATTARRSGAGS